jgi:lipid II:glycine glycyltransferase (peptidoglycan interpeptide bridge formation enzyme)
MNKKQAYRELCKTEQTIPIYSKDWWLDAVCGEDNWDVALIEKGDHIVATMPYYTKRKMGLTIITMPPFTQTLGPWIRPSPAKYAKQLAKQKDLMNGLIEQLPAYDDFDQNFHYTITNWLPFYWKGFKQTTRYTYLLNCVENLEKIQSDFEKSVRTKIRKAISNDISIIENDEVDTLFKLHATTYRKQGIRMPYTLDELKKLYIACKKHDAVQMLFAKYRDEIIAGVFYVYDKMSLYAILGGSDRYKKDTGAEYLLDWEMIKFCHDKKIYFDFEGSMLEGVERRNRAFGAVQKPYFQISDTSKRMHVVYSGRNIIRRLRG